MAHAGPALLCPSTSHRLRPLALDLRVITEDRSGDDWVNRTVSVNGTISVSNQVFSVGKQRAGANVDVRILENLLLENLLEVWDGNELIKSVLRTTKGEVRKKKSEVH